MIVERMIELDIFLKLIGDPSKIDREIYDKKRIYKRYLTLKKEFLEPYKKDSSQK